ncbi:hypothetical protein VTL71DRAFT_8126 [Oculimacula yallundae]|uniref:BTB domain-containing protein n=1 Tax=Oculimacula yallundae TaxID=86028 RepID=A0ABR4CY82_9HELO
MEQPSTAQRPNLIPNTTFQRPGPQKLLELLKSETIKIYIGPEQKLYTVPRELICYHSTVLKTHFDKETPVRSDIPFKRPKHVRNNAKHLYDCLPDREAIDECIALLDYADKLDMADMVSEVVFEIIRHAVRNLMTPPTAASNTIPRREVPKGGFTGEDIKVVFRATKADNALRLLVAQDVLSRQGLKGVAFKDEEINVPGFAAEVLDQFRESASFWAWTDPMNGLQRTYDGF